MKQSITFVTLATKDFDTQLSFYREVLHWNPFNVIDHTIAFFNVGSFVFSLCAYEELRNDVGRELATTPFLGVTLALNLPSEDKVRDLFAQLTQAGVEVVKPPERAS
ncbi:MAG: VOC family protein [Acidimicrobiales bacterium]